MGLVFAGAKVVLITNATGLDRAEVRHALEFLDEHNGEVWAKLDAGTPEYFARINCTAVPYLKVLGNIWACARERPIVIQSCFVRLNGSAPPPEELAAYAVAPEGDRGAGRQDQAGPGLHRRASAGRGNQQLERRGSRRDRRARAFRDGTARGSLSVVIQFGGGHQILGFHAVDAGLIGIAFFFSFVGRPRIIV